jgi:hypothetical protein
MKDETGKTYGSLKVLSHADKGYWNVQCVCGTTFRARGNDMRRGRMAMCQRCFQERRLTAEAKAEIG